MSARLAAAVAVVFLAACGAAPPSAAGPRETPGPTAPAGPRVEMPSGAVYTVELARSPEEQTQGLMYRESLPPRSGMLFLFDEAAPHHFWMKNTMIPLDMIWTDESGRVLFVSADTPPCRADPCPTYGPDVPARNVLEIAGGMAAKEGVAAGATLRLFEIPNP